MTLPAFATVAHLIARGVKITGDEDSADSTRAQAALDDVSALIRAVAHKTWANDAGDELVDVPDVVHAVCCAAARRQYENPQNLRSESIREYTDVRSGDVVGGLGLSDEEKQLVEQAAASTSPGLWALGTTRGPLETPGRCAWRGDPVMLPTTVGEPIAWLDPSELPPT